MPEMSETSGRSLMFLSHRARLVRDLAVEVGKVSPSRELSLAVTKLEGAEMWAARAALLASKAEAQRG